MSRVPRSANYGWLARLVFWLSKRRLGKVPTPQRWVGLHSKVLLPWVMMMAAQESAHAVAPGLKSLARIQTARLVGCPF